MRRLLIVALLATGYGPADAQEAQEVPLAEALAQVALDSPVRVRATAGNPIFSGRFLRVESDSLYLGARGGVQSIPLVAIEALWTRPRGLGWLGAAILNGVSIGAAAAYLSMIVPTLFCDCDVSWGWLQWTVASGVLVGAVGEGGWRRVYPG